MAQLENFRLKVFRTVAEQSSFRTAAELLFLSQPAVTFQIKALEEDLGVRLFLRTAGKIALTKQGTILLRHAQKIAAVAPEAERKLSAHERQLSGPLSIGVSTTIAQDSSPEPADNPPLRRGPIKPANRTLELLARQNDSAATNCTRPEIARKMRCETTKQQSPKLVAPLPDEIF